MFSAKTLKAIEYDKMMQKVSDYAVLGLSKERLLSFSPVSELSEAEFLLEQTKEAFALLYKYNVSGVYFFDDVSEELQRADKGGILNNAELIKVAQNLKSARLLRTGILTVKDDKIRILTEIASRLFTNQNFEDEISSKIISDDEISDNASPKLYSIRKEIRNINARIREQLNSYMRGNMSKYLQDGVVTMRGDRYVIPVKSEYRSAVKGFVHDRSSSGATVFIEPEQVIELNNDLKSAIMDEAVEIRRILAELSAKVSTMSAAIGYNAQNISEIDVCFAKATYSFKFKCTYPNLNDRGVVKILNGRHPLIAQNSVVPVSVELGENYNFLLITGPNTGGKTVTLKLTGLLTLMAMSGLYIPASDNSEISVFNGIYCDIGDEQSIEQNLSTFSSHINNIKNIIESVDGKSLILLDEIGAGTDPEEGSALALALIEKLLTLNCFGIITTHYSRLKEYAAQSDCIENASMEFDSHSLKPVYKLNIGIPGSSNAIDIAKTLGLDAEIIDNANSYLSNDKINFENVLKKAEESRRAAERAVAEAERLKDEKQAELIKIQAEREKIEKEREKIYNTAKQETKRIVADKLVEAEEIIAELKSILKKVGLESKEVFRAGELRNRLKNSRYLSIETDSEPIELVEAGELLKVGCRVYVKSLGAYAEVCSVKKNKGEAEVIIGNIKTVVKIKDVFNPEQPVKEQEKINVSKSKSSNNSVPKTELNVIGKTSLEAIDELVDFIDQAVVNNIEEIKVIHGVGKGVLLKEIRNYLKTDKNVLEFRRGKYGEGENGVTIIKLK